MTNKHALVTITAIMAARNAEATIETAIRSLLKQTLPVTSVIVVDDQSTDATARVVENIGAGQVRLIRLRAHSGRSAARNVGIAASGSEFIAIADADDISLPWRLETTYEHLIRTEAVASGGQMATFWSEATSASVRFRWPTEPEEIRETLVRGSMPLAHPTLLGRKEIFEAVGGYDETDYSGAEDLGFVKRLSVQGTLAASGDIVLLYRRRPRDRWGYMWRTHRGRRAIMDTGHRGPLAFGRCLAAFGATTDAARGWIRPRVRRHQSVRFEVDEEWLRSLVSSEGSSVEDLPVGQRESPTTLGSGSGV